MISLKRFLITFIIFVLFISIFHFSQAAQEVTLSIDENVLDSEFNPILENGRTVAPVRVIAEHLNAVVTWEGSSQTVTIDKGDKHIELVIDQSVVKRNDESLQLAITPKLIDGKTYVPLRFVSEVLEYKVGWNNELKRVELVTPKEDSNQEDNTDENEDSNSDNNNFTINDITKIRIEDDYAIMLEVNEGVKYKTTILPNPDRYVIDFVDTKFNIEKSELDNNGVLHINDFGSEYIKSVRASQFKLSPLTSRVVLDLTDVKGYPHINRVDGKLAIYYSNSPNGKVIEQTKPNDQEDENEQSQEDEQGNLEFGRTNYSFEINTFNKIDYTVSGVTSETERIYGKINGSYVNLRSEPSLSGGESTVVYTVKEGTEVKVIGQQSGWYEILYKNKNLWIDDSLLAVELEMKRNNVNVRKEKGLNKEILENIPTGTKIKVIERHLDWEKVITDNGTEGYIADYLVALNERLLNGVNQSDTVAEEIEITLKNIHKSDVSLSDLPEIVLNSELLSKGQDTLIKIKLAKPIAFRHEQVENAIKIDLGSILEEVRVTEDQSKVTVEMFFDMPTGFVIHQNQLKDNFMLDFLYAVVKEEKEFDLEGKIASKVFTNSNSESTEVNVKLGNIGTYKLNTTEYSDYVKLELLSSSLDGKVIALDPGHGGNDGGASEAGIRESDINLSVALKVRDILMSRGVTVILTRDNDYKVHLGERANMINNHNADIAISFHVNASRYGTASGVETYFYPEEENQRLARALQRALTDATGFRDRGVKQWKELFFTRNTRMPSALLEMGFIDNSTERAFLISELGQNKIAEDIVAAIERFFLYQ